jgi:signal transduction histidine kinase
LFKPDKIKRTFSPIYLAIFSGVILAIVFINGLLEVNRTQKGFYLLLEREATVLLQHYEKNVQEAMVAFQMLENGSGKDPFTPPISGFFFGLEESVTEYLVEAVHRVDQMDREKPLTLSDFQSLINQYLITSVAIYDSQGNLLRGLPSHISSPKGDPLLHPLIEKKRSVVVDLFTKPLAEDHLFSVAISRETPPGIIVLQLSAKQLTSLSRQWVIQKAISDIVLREDVLFVSVQDDHFNTLAHTDASLIGRREEDPFLRNALKSNRPVARLYPFAKGEEVFEVAKSFFFKEKPMGVIRIGYSPKEIYPVLRQIKRNVALSIFFFVALGFFATTWIWINQNRHLRKMKEMEDRIQLAERLSSLGHLAAGVAHEIRNPLNAIGMGLQRLQREFLPQDPSKKVEYTSFTELILKEIRRMNEIIERFLTLSRPFHLDLRVSSLRELLDNLITLFQEEASSRGIILRQQADPELPPVKMDSERLTQALINIMKNGMEATGPGGVLSIESHTLKDRVMVTISDSGSGIPPDQIEKIFNYYYTTKEKGVGLGLPIAHRIIEAHGGQLLIESQVGFGTKVTVRLPV